MSTQADYTPEEWATLRRAPMVAGLALSLADPGGAIELTKETLAALRVASDPAGHGDLVALVSADIAALTVSTKPARPLQAEGRGRTAAGGRRARRRTRT